MSKPSNIDHARYLKYRNALHKTEKRFQNPNNIDKFRAGRTTILSLEQKEEIAKKMNLKLFRQPP